MSNHWQWDAVWADGDMFKAGTFSQGLYPSPARDLGIVWFSILYNDMTRYARAIASVRPRDEVLEALPSSVAIAGAGLSLGVARVVITESNGS